MRRLRLLAILIVFLGFSSLVKAEHPVYNTGVAGYEPSISGNIIAFMADEWGDSKDYNDNGYIGDNVVVYYNTSTQTLTTTNYPGYEVGIDGDIIAFQHDPGVGATILAYTDLSTGNLVESGVNGKWPTVSGPIISFQTSESTLGQDFNQDGDLYENVVAYWDTSTGEIVPVGLLYYWHMVDGTTIAFATKEGDLGEDLNNDGDTSDRVIRYHDITTGVTHNTGMVGDSPAISGSIITFTTREADLGEDFNSDGDLYDRVIRYYDIASGDVVNVVSGWGSAIDGAIIAYNTKNDQNDWVIGYYDIGTGVAVNTDIIGTFSWVDLISGSKVTFQTYESDVGMDLNGDGDLYDSVVRYTVLPLEPEGVTAIEDQIDELVDSGVIEDAGVVNSLESFTEQAQAMLDKDNTTSAEKILQAFIKGVEAKRGKQLDESAADQLVESAQGAIESIQ